MAYKTEKFNLLSQSIAGIRLWTYADTGALPANVVGAGYFADAGSKGVSVGDPIEIVNLSTPDRYQGHFTVAQDTGATQGTVVLDTD
jgi:hypothetical protein